MGLTEHDLNDIYLHLRKQVQASRFASLDEEIAMATRSADSARERLQDYLRILISSVRQRSGTLAHSINRRFAEFLKTKSGEHFGGVEIAFSDSETKVYGVHALDLDELDDSADRFVHELHEILDAVISDNDGQSRP